MKCAGGRTECPAGLLESNCLLARSTAGWQGDADRWIAGWNAMATVNCSPPHGRSKSNTQLTPPAQGCGLSQHMIHPSLRSSTPTNVLCLLPYCHTTHTKNKVRTKAHIRRAGGSTLSRVRNNSFWPSPACVLKWSPWVAAYQRAVATEWAVGITQPGYRTYTGHSKCRAHWVSEIHGNADCARMSFDWDYVIMGRQQQQIEKKKLEFHLNFTWTSWCKPQEIVSKMPNFNVIRNYLIWN